MAVSPARRKYFITIISLMLIYVGATEFISWLQQSVEISSLQIILFSLVPMAALFKIFMVHWRFIKTLDEYLQSLQIKAMLVGLVVLLLIISTWGFLETHNAVHSLQMFWLLPIFLMTYAFSVRFLKMQNSSSTF